MNISLLKLAVSRLAVFAAALFLIWWLNPTRGADSVGVPDVVYEDGSGIEYLPGGVTREWPADTFPWDCTTMGNRVCGSVDDAHIVG